MGRPEEGKGTRGKGRGVAVLLVALLMVACSNPAVRPGRVRPTATPTTFPTHPSTSTSSPTSRPVESAVPSRRADATPTPAATSAVQPHLQQVSGSSPFAACSKSARQVGQPFVNSEVETWVAVNPRSSRNVVATWQQDRWSTDGATGIVDGVSADGGATWKEVVIPGLTKCTGGSYDRASDPWLSFAPDGTLYQASLGIAEIQAGKAPARSDVLVNTSQDGGLHWSAPVTLADQGFNDKETLTADPYDARYAYAVWGHFGGSRGGPVNVVWFTRTTDGGKHWEAPRTIFTPPAKTEALANEIVVLTDGTLLDEFTELHGSTATIYTLRSNDHGVTWPGQPVKVADVQPAGAFAADIKCSPNKPCRRSMRAPGQIAHMVVNRNQGSRGYGSLYAVWGDGRFSHTHDDIAFSESADGGRTWTQPVQVNRSHGAPAFAPAIAVAADGSLGVTYYDFRNNTPDPSTLPTDYWLTRCGADCSQPGSWRETHIAGPFDMLEAPYSQQGCCTELNFVGDYQGLAVEGDSFLPVFAMPRGGDPASVFTTRIRG